jgi:hypothetical protein
VAAAVAVRDERSSVLLTLLDKRGFGGSNGRVLARRLGIPILDGVPLLAAGKWRGLTRQAPGCSSPAPAW